MTMPASQNLGMSENNGKGRSKTTQMLEALFTAKILSKCNLARSSCGFVVSPHVVEFPGVKFPHCSTGECNFQILSGVAVTTVVL